MEAVLRGAVMFLFLWLVLRLIGKRELSELTAFQFVILATMGDVVQQGITQEDMSVTGAFISVGVMAWLLMVMAWLSWRSRRLRPALEGRPVVLISDGKVLDEALRVEQVPMNDVLEAARQEGIDDLRGVRWAVLEVDGRISFVTGNG